MPGVRVADGLLNVRTTDVSVVTRPQNLWHALLLAVPPTVVVLAMTAIVQVVGHARFVFAPLAASAFLIYRSPRDRSNHVSVVVSAHLTALAVALIVAWFGRPGYVSEMTAMMLTIVALLMQDALHAPAVATALLFADLPIRMDHAVFFLIDVVLLAMLCLLQQKLHDLVSSGGP